MIFNKNQITHIGEYDSGSKVYMRKNKCGQWNVLILDRKGYRWDMLNYVNYPKTIYGVTQSDLEDHLFESTRVLKQEKYVNITDEKFKVGETKCMTQNQLIHLETIAQIISGNIIALVILYFYGLSP